MYNKRMSIENIKTAPADRGEEGRIEVETREEALQMAEKALQKKLEERYREFPFHNPEHSKDVAEGSVRFLEFVEKIAPNLVSKEDKELARLIGFGHDLVQDADTHNSEGVPLPMRVRHRGFGAEDTTGRKQEGNEYKSAMELLEELRKYENSNGKVFRAESGGELERKIMRGVAVTYPETDMKLLISSGFKDLKIFQQYLGPKSSILDLAIATADLRGPLAADDFEVFRKSGDAEFRELNVATSEEVARGIENISQERRGQIAQSIKNWKNTQISFANWQKTLFEESVNENEMLQKAGESVIQAIKNAYLPNMDRNIEETKRIAAESQSLSPDTDENFRKALKAVGYEIEY